MSIRVKFFASLRDQLGTSDIEVTANNIHQVRDVWQVATQSADFPANTLCAVNMQYARLDDAVNDGDEVAFFPPVTGG